MRLSNISIDLLKCFERASASDIDDEERQRLLTFVVVGGGPTCVEFTSELYDFVKGWYCLLRFNI